MVYFQFLYVNQSFAPALDVDVGTLYEVIIQLIVALRRSGHTGQRSPSDLTSGKEISGSACIISIDRF